MDCIKQPIGKVGIYFFLAIILLQCQGYEEEQSYKNSDKKTDFINSEGFSEEVTIKYAQNFRVENHPTYKLVHIQFKSEEQDINFDQKILLYPKGSPPTGLETDFNETWQVAVPIQTVAANDDGEITRLSALGLKDNIIAMGGGGIYEPDLRKRWEDKKIASIGYSFHQAPQAELILALNPDLLMLYSYDHGRLEALHKLRVLGINAIPQFAWAEPSILGKAEWIKFTALFFDKGKKANETFDKIVQRSEELKSLSAKNTSKKTVFMTYHPSSESDWSVHRNDFYTSFLAYAGAVNILQDEGPTHPVGMNNEHLLSLAKDADIWITNSTSDLEWPPLSYLNSFKAYRNKEVFHYQKRTRLEHNAYDWYETPEVRPDLVIEDLVSIFYPELLPNHNLLFFDRAILKK
ncbi:MAG: ABC transporter substrate-binding protein [Bacteroidota bacterium]